MTGQPAAIVLLSLIAIPSAHAQEKRLWTIISQR
jgi:hypothetical protein